MEIGLFCSSNRPQLWKELCKNLSQNDIDWNLCIAGPNPPIEPLPGNVKYIQTNVKPAQCFFIAANNVKGDCVAPINDDLILSPGCLDDMSKLLEGKEMTIVSPYFAVGGDTNNKASHYVLWDARGYPDGDSRSNRKNKMYRGMTLALNLPLPWISFMHRDTFSSVGIDKNYVALWWNIDAAMELVSRGGETIVSETSYGYDFLGGSDSLCQITWDIFYLADMWVDQAIVGGADKKVRTTRKEPIDPLVYNDTVLTVSQGRVYPPLLEGSYIIQGNRKITPRWI